MLGLQQLSLFLLLFGKAHGDLISVKKENETVACITSNFEYAMVFIKKPVNDTDFTKVEYLDGKGEPVMMTKYDCNLITDNCTPWNRIKHGLAQGWLLSGHKTGDLITDFRWNDLPTHFINATSFSEQFEKIGEFHATFHFSILATEQVEILVAGGSQDNAEQINFINIFEDRIVSGIKQLKDKIWQSSPGNQKTIKGKNILHGGKKWIHVTVFVGAKNPTSAVYGDGQVLFRVERSACGKDSCVLYLNSTGEALYKIHQYKTLFSNSINSTMNLEVLEDLNGFCVDIVFYYSKKVLNKAFELTIMQGNKVVRRFSQNADPSNVHKWLTRRFQDNAMELKENWKIRLTAGREVKIGAIKFCAGGDSNIIKPKGENVESCNLLAVRDHNLPTKERLFEVANNLAVCHALGEYCSALTTCRENGECVNFPDITSKEGDSKKTISTTQPPPPSETTMTTQSTSTKTTFQEPISSDTGSNLSRNISCDAEVNKNLHDMIILTILVTSWNIGSYIFLAFQLFYYFR